MTEGVPRYKAEEQFLNELQTQDTSGGLTIFPHKD